MEVTGTSFQLKMDGFRCSASAALSRLSLVCCQVGMGSDSLTHTVGHCRDL